MRTRLNRFFFTGSKRRARRLVILQELLRMNGATGKIRVSPPLRSGGATLRGALINLAAKNPNEKAQWKHRDIQAIRRFHSSDLQDTRPTRRSQGFTECRPTKRNESRRVLPCRSAEGGPVLIPSARSAEVSRFEFAEFPNFG